MDKQHPIKILLVLLFTLAACAPSPTSSNISPLQGKNVMLSDDFSPPNAAWTLFDTPEGSAYVQQGELYIEDRGQGIGIYTQLMNHTWEDVLISMRVRQVEGSQNNWMGLTCRQQDEENYYLFAISADGYYLILKMEEGMRTRLAGPAKSTIISPGKETNQLEVSCEGSTLALSVNGQKLATRTDGSFTGGNVALFADAVEGGSMTTAAFDAFVISEP